MRMKSCLFAILILFCNALADSSAPQPEDVSMVQLIANPKEHDGKFVRLIGYVNLQFEGNGIFLHSEDCKRGITANGLWLEVSDEVLKQRKKYRHHVPGLWLP